MINESGVSFYPGGGHNHDGQNSTLINTSVYSVYDFPFQIVGDPSRTADQLRNLDSFKQLIIDTVNQSIIAPSGIVFQQGIVNGSAHIISRSISTESIATDAITANEIAANTITADEIATGAITADEIAAGTITANEIEANTITANEIAANSITANEIAANTITANEINAGYVYAGNISADQINAGIITSREINNGNGTFRVLSNGALTATSADITGDISTNNLDATGGTIGGWSINASTLSSPNNQTILNPNGNITIAGNLEATGYIDANDSLRTSGYVEADNINDEGITCDGLTAFGTPNRMGLVWDNPDFIGVVDAGGAVMILGTASDVRLKENVTNLEHTFIEKLLNDVRIVEYTPKAILANDVPKTKKRTGIIAQEIINVFPDLVVGDYENPEKILSVNYAGFVPYLIKTAQYMSNQIKTLEARIAELEG